MIQFKILRTHHDYRWMYVGQLVSLFGNMMSYVVVPYQIYQITKDSYMVGLLSLVQMIPLIIFGLLGGSVADRVHRKKLMLLSEVIMLAASALLLLNASIQSPNVWIIFIAVTIMQSALAYHRPSVEAMMQKMVEAKDFHQVATLSSFSFAFAAIAGPALGGYLVALLDLRWAFAIDMGTFVFALFTILKLKGDYQISSEKTAQSSKIIVDLKEGLAFAWKDKAVFGSYLVDIVAMLFAFPIALYPAIAENYSDKGYLGWLYSSMAIGALIISTFFSNQLGRIFSRGKAILLSAAIWGLGVLFFGLTYEIFWLGFFCMFVAGAADTVSGIHRRLLWNERIPNVMRGRLAGLEMMSYMTGPLLGNYRSGAFASLWGNRASIVSGGVLCVAGMLLLAVALPTFWKYRSSATQ